MLSDKKFSMAAKSLAMSMPMCSSGSQSAYLVDFLDDVAQALDAIFSAIKTIRNPKALKLSIIKNLILNECPCPDYYTCLMTTKANNNAIKTVHDVMSLLVKRKEAPIPAELTDD